jgi:hypothetical protein
MRKWISLLLVSSAVLFAADKPFVKGKLVDLVVAKRTVGVPSNGGTLIVQKNLFQVAVQIEDLVYKGETRSGEVRELVIGDPVDVRVEEKDFYVRRPNGKEIKVRLLTKARAAQ